VKAETGPNAGAYYYTRDHLGSIRELTDGSGTVRARYAYDPFGRRTKVSGDVDADFGFTGMFWASETALGLSRYRAYDPELGRWLSRDPLRFAEAAQGPNLYAYAGNEPLNHIDPEGLTTVPGPGFNSVTIGVLSVCSTDPGECAEFAQAVVPGAAALPAIAPEIPAFAECGSALAQAAQVVQAAAQPAMQTLESVAPGGASAAIEFAETATADTMLPGEIELPGNFDWADAWLRAMLNLRDYLPTSGQFTRQDHIDLTLDIIARFKEIRGILDAQDEIQAILHMLGE